MKRNITKGELIEFEGRIVKLFESGKIPYPVHLSGGNEDDLIEIFEGIGKEDYVFSTHRSHYHYLLAGGSQEKLEKMILDGKSICISDKELNFFSSAIVCGTPAIATGVALGIKRNGGDDHVWCFIGDGAEDEGHFYEAVRYVDGHNLPCTFVVEDNDRSVETTREARYNNSKMIWPECVKRYNYSATYPHVGTGKWVDLSGIKAGEKWM